MTANNMMELMGRKISGISTELKLLGAPFGVQLVSSVKPNLGEVFGFVTKPAVEDGMMHPVIYWEPSFAELTDRQLAAFIINKYIEASKDAGQVFPEILTRQNVLKSVLPKVIGADENLRIMESSGIPYQLIEGTDLMIVLYVPLEAAGGTIPVTGQILELTHTTAEELFPAARQHILSQMTISPLAGVMAEMAGAAVPFDTDDDPGFLPLYVGTNTSSHFGAGILAGGSEAFRRMASRIGTDEFFILPSSLHEVLLLEDEGQFDLRELLAMVREINAEVVAPQDRLTDNVYRVSGSTGQITHCK